MLLGFGALALAGYALWAYDKKQKESNEKKPGFASATKCEGGTSPVELWYNYPKYPKQIVKGCFNKRTNAFYLPS